MRTRAIAVLVFVMVIAGGLPLAFGAHEGEKEKPSPEGDAKRGEFLFRSPMMLGTIPISCASCHPGGMGLERAYGKKEFSIMGNKVKRIEAVINFWIVNILRGEGIKYDSQDMKDIKAYLKTLSAKPQRPLPRAIPMERLDVDRPDVNFGGSVE